MGVFCPSAERSQVVTSKLDLDCADSYAFIFAMDCAFFGEFRRTFVGQN